MLQDFDTFLFDLDGTLLGISDETFANEFTPRIYQSFSDLIEPELFFYGLQSSYDLLYDNRNPNKYLMEIFLSNFTKITGIDFDEAESRILGFYSTTFNEMEEFVIVVPKARKLITYLQNQGKQIVLATNPVFPEISTRKRCSWAGFDLDEFSFVPTIETSSFCKPNPEYYYELLKRVDAKTAKSLMIGNDHLYDMSASAVGIKTWLTTEFQSNQKYTGKYDITYSGTITNLYEKLVE